MYGKVYSYLRFSAAKQASGASAARQTDYARKWAADHGLELDSTLSMRDEGLSAFHQKHVKRGALGTFLEAVRSGQIPNGSVLIVEGLDRLSRAEPMEAQAQLQSIVFAGITVVTAGDNKEYSRESLRENPMDLIYSILVMIRANEESATKSKRVADQLRRKCEGWVEGTYRGKVSCGADPSWVRWTDGKFELDPVNAPAVRRVISMFTEGLGAMKIINVLSAEGIVTTGMRQANNINQLVCAKPELFTGDRRLIASGQEFILRGYYPALLTEDEYARLIVEIARRRKTPRNVVGKVHFPSVLTGSGITTCGHCGAAVVGRNQRRNPRRDGALYDRRCACPRCEISKQKPASCTAEMLERAVFDYCSDQMNLSALSGDDPAVELRLERARLAQQISEGERRAAKFADMVLIVSRDVV